MTVITISTQLGSEGTRIAQDLAVSLGYHFTDKNTFAGVLSKYGLVEFNREYGSYVGFWGQFSARRLEIREEIKRMLHDTTLALAYHGNVVMLGRGAFPVVSSFDDVLSVRVQAPLPLRIARVMERENITDHARAKTNVTKDDTVRAAYVKSMEGVRTDASGLYDLVVDTHKIPQDAALTLILQTNDILKHRKSIGGRTTASIVVDPLLASTVSAELACQVKHR